MVIKFEDENATIDGQSSVKVSIEVAMERMEIKANQSGRSGNYPFKSATWPETTSYDPFIDRFR